MFRLKSIGAKIILVTISLVFVCLLLLSGAIIYTVNQAQTKLTESLLDSMSSEVSKVVRGITNEAYISLLADIDNVRYIMNSENLDINRLQTIIKSMLTSSKWTNYAYFYTNNPQYANATNPLFRLGSGEFMILIGSNNQFETSILKANANILDLDSVRTTLQAGQTTVSVPNYYQLENGKKVFGAFMNVALKNGAKTEGVLGVFIDLDELSEEINKGHFVAFEGGYQAVMTEKGTFAAHLSRDLLGKDFLEVNASESGEAILKAVKEHQNGIFKYTSYEGISSLVSINVFEVGYHTGTFWACFSVAPTASIFASVYRTINLIIAFSIIALLIIALSIYVYIKTNVSIRIERISELYSFCEPR